MGSNALEPSFLPCEPDQPITEAASIIPECEAHELIAYLIIHEMPRSPTTHTWEREQSSGA
jgi:hypothetical protein